MDTSSLKTMDRSTTEGIYASSLSDSSLYSQHINHSSPHQPARQDTGLTPHLPGSQLRPLGMDHPSARPTRSDNTAFAVDEILRDSASSLNSFVPECYNPTTTPRAGGLDGSEDACAQHPRRRVATLTPSQRSEKAPSRQSLAAHNNTTATTIPRSPKSPSGCQSSTVPVEYQEQHKHQHRSDSEPGSVRPASENHTALPTHSEAPHTSTKIDQEYKHQSEADSLRPTPDRFDNTAATSFSLSPMIYHSIEHDDYQPESGPSQAPNHGNTAATSFSVSLMIHPSVEHDHYQCESGPSQASNHDNAATPSFSLSRMIYPSIEHDDYQPESRLSQDPDNYVNTAAPSSSNSPTTHSQSPQPFVEYEHHHQSGPGISPPSPIHSEITSSCSPTSHSCSPQPHVKMENQDQYELDLSPQTSEHLNNAATSFSYSPTLHSRIVYPSIEHDEHQSESHLSPQTPDEYSIPAGTSTTAFEYSASSSRFSSRTSTASGYQNESDSVTSRQFPDSNVHTAATSISPTSKYSPNSFTASAPHQGKPGPGVFCQTPDRYSHTATKPTPTTFECSRVPERGSNKRSSDVAFSLPLESPDSQRAAKRQRADISADEPQSPNSCRQASLFPTTNHADKRSHADAFPDADQSQSVPCQAPKKQRTEDRSSRSSPSSRRTPGRRPTRFAFRDYIRKQNRPGVSPPQGLQYDGAADPPSPKNHGEQEREGSPDSLFDDDESSPGQENTPGEREVSPSAPTGAEECTREDKSLDAGVTLPDSSSSVEGECPSANPPQTTTAPVEVQGTNGIAEVAACGPAGKPPGLRALLSNQPTDNYTSPYGPCGEVRAPVVRANPPPPVNLHRASVETPIPHEEGKLIDYQRRIKVLTNERDAARKKVEFWAFVDPTTGKTREQMLKAEPLQLKRALNAQERKTRKAQCEAEEWKRRYDMLMLEHNTLLRHHSALMGLVPPEPVPHNQVWLGPLQNGSGSVMGPAPSSSQRRPVPPPSNGADGRGAVANPPSQANVVDLTGEDQGAAIRPQFSTARPGLQGAPSPAVAVTPTANVAAAPVPAPALAPGVPAAPVAKPTPSMRPNSRIPANANAKAKANQAHVPAPVTPAPVVPATTPAPTLPTTTVAAPKPAAKSTSPEAEELHARFRTKDYGWLGGNNHMQSRIKPTFGPNCAPPCPALPIVVPASRFKRRGPSGSAATNAATRRAIDAAAASASPPPVVATEPEGPVGITTGETLGDEVDGGGDLDELEREMEEELAKGIEEEKEEVRENGGGEEKISDEQLARELEEELAKM